MNSPGHRGQRLWNLACFIFQIDNHWVQQKLGIHSHNRPCSAGRRQGYKSHGSDTPLSEAAANAPSLRTKNLSPCLNRWAPDLTHYLKTRAVVMNTDQGRWASVKQNCIHGAAWRMEWAPGTCVIFAGRRALGSALFISEETHPSLLTHTCKSLSLASFVS